MNCSILNRFRSGEKDEDEELTPYDGRVYVEFKRFTETFIMLDGTERTFTYDDGLLDRNRVSISDNGLYRIHSATQHKSSSPVIRASFKKLGEVDRDSVPVIEQEAVEDMVAYVNVHRQSNGWWDFQSDINVVPRDEFSIEETDEQGRIVKR